MAAFLEPLSAIFGWVVRSTVEASVVICLILAVQAILRRKLAPKWHYALWLLLVIRLAMPWAPGSSVSVFNWIPSIGDPAPKETLDRIVVAEHAPRTSTISPATTTAPPEAPETWESTELFDSASIGNTRPVVRYSPPSLSFLETSALIWMSGALVLLACVLVQTGLFSARVFRQRPVTDHDILDLLESCKKEMGIRAPIRLVQTSRVGSPALLGAIRPRLVVPNGMFETLSTDQIKFVFLHELAHLKRHDILVNWVTTLLQIIHWFNPLIWFAFHRMRADRELACDALVLMHAGPEDSPRYGQTILHLLERFSQPRRLPGLAGILEDRSQLKRRIAMIAQFKETPPRRSVLGLVLLGVLGCVALTDANDGTTPPPEKVPDGPDVVSSVQVSAPPVSADDDDQLKEELLAELEALAGERSEAVFRSWDITLLRSYKEARRLEQESLEESVVQLFQVRPYRGDLAPATFTAEIPLYDGMEGWEHVKAMLCSRRVMKVLHELAREPKNRASELISRQIQDNLPKYQAKFKEKILADPRLRDRENTGGLGFTMGNNRDGSPTLQGLRYSLFALVMIAGTLELEGTQDAVQAVAEVAVDQRDFFYKHGQEDFNYSLSIGALQWASLYNRQMLVTGLVGTAALDDAATPLLRESLARRLKKEPTEVTPWSEVLLPNYNALTTPYEDTWGSMPVDYTKGVIPVRHLYWVTDEDFDAIYAMFKERVLSNQQPPVSAAEPADATTDEISRAHMEGETLLQRLRAIDEEMFNDFTLEYVMSPALLRERLGRERYLLDGRITSSGEVWALQTLLNSSSPAPTYYLPPKHETRFYQLPNDKIVVSRPGRRMIFIEPDFYGVLDYQRNYLMTGGGESTEIRTTNPHVRLDDPLNPVGDWNIRIPLLCTGRGFARYITRIENVEELDSGLISIMAEGVRPSETPRPCVWRMEVDPELGYLVRKVEYINKETGMTSKEFESNGVLFTEKGVIAEAGRSRYAGERASSIYRGDGWYDVTYVALKDGADHALIEEARGLLQDPYPEKTLVTDDRGPQTISYFVGEVKAGVFLSSLIDKPVDVITDEIRRAHLERVQKIQTLRLTWKGTRILMNGDGVDGYPEEPTVLRNDGEITISGSSNRMVRQMDLWHINRKEVSHHDVEEYSVFDEGVGKILDHSNRGVVSTDNTIEEFRVRRAIISSYIEDPRYLRDEMAILRQQQTSEGEMVVIGDPRESFITPGQRYHLGNGKYGVLIDGPTEYFLDPNRDYLLTKIRTVNEEGDVLNEVNVKYEADPAVGFMPVESTYVARRSDSKTVKETQNIEIQSFEVNIPVDPETFELEFPVGTSVLDRLAGVEYTVGEETPPTAGPGP